MGPPPTPTRYSTGGSTRTSECYLMLANTRREIWFIPQRHVRAWKLLDGDEMFVRKVASAGPSNGQRATVTTRS